MTAILTDHEIDAHTERAVDAHLSTLPKAHSSSGAFRERAAQEVRAAVREYLVAHRASLRSQK